MLLGEGIRDKLSANRTKGVDLDHTKLLELCSNAAVGRLTPKTLWRVAKVTKTATRNDWSSITREMGEIASIGEQLACSSGFDSFWYIILAGFWCKNDYWWTAMTCHMIARVGKCSKLLP